MTRRLGDKGMVRQREMVVSQVITQMTRRRGDKGMGDKEKQITEIY
jgi:hypothetical protein